MDTKGKNKNGNSHIIKQVNNFNYLGYTVTVTNNRDLETKMKLT
jgi:hypothetical protein